MPGQRDLTVTKGLRARAPDEFGSGGLEPACDRQREEHVAQNAEDLLEPRQGLVADQLERQTHELTIRVGEE